MQSVLDSVAINNGDLDQLVGLFRLLSDKTRMSILVLLADGEKNVTSLCQALGLPQPTVSHHLGLLRMHNIIACRRNGKQVIYALDGKVRLGEDRAMQIGVENVSLRIGLGN